MDVFQAIILGIVQGITEWLPISSKSHLLLIQHLFNLAPPVLFDLILHMGSLLVVIFVFWKDIKALILGLFQKNRESWLMLGFLALATVPIAVCGFFLERVIKNTFNDLRILGFGLLFTALILYLSSYPLKKEKKVTLGKSLLIGCSQVFALFPGISRSGMTISTGMMLGIKKETVATFSFLLFIPAILGATLLEFKDIGQITNVGALLVGTLVTVIVGYFSLKLLLHVIKKGKFAWFGLYCALLGVLVLLLAYGVF
ncbi:MAG: undecaprenyl-diphosphate phosphatase [archaeon]